MSEWSNPPSDPLAAAAKRVLDESVQDLDQTTIFRVQRMRLNVLDSSSFRRPWLRWTSGMVLASMAALALMLWIWPSGGGNHSHLPLLEDLELMQSSENIELSEDLEFYDWLADGSAANG
jgi:CubicO group peptidase (beta-lactamase class C family)